MGAGTEVFSLSYRRSAMISSADPLTSSPRHIRCSLPPRLARTTDATDVASADLDFSLPFQICPTSRRTDARTEAAAPVTMATLAARVESATGTPVPPLPLSSVRRSLAILLARRDECVHVDDDRTCFARRSIEMISNGGCQIDMIRCRMMASAISHEID